MINLFCDINILRLARVIWYGEPKFGRVNQGIAMDVYLFGLIWHPKATCTWIIAIAVCFGLHGFYHMLHFMKPSALAIALL